MKTRVLSFVIASILFTGITGLSRAQEDDRVMGRLSHNGAKDQPRTSSFYILLNGNKADGLPALRSGAETRFYSRVWEGLYLQILTVTGERGAAGYKFAFSKDEADLNLVGTKEFRDVPSLLEVAAADFRSEDNFSPRALKAGPGTPDDRGAFRLIQYDGFDVEIRVLEFNIGEAGLKKKPFFKSVSCLVTVIEKR